MTVAVAGASSSGATTPSARADSCPDVEVVFARGSGEAPGLGSVGGPFVDALRSQIGSRSLAVYPVNYPASTDFASSDFPAMFIEGIRDASAHIESVAANCPNTREVIGGYSQGAAVVGYATSPAIPQGAPPGVPPPLPPQIANHIAAVTLFGTPSGQFLDKYHAPALVIGPQYQAKTLELCASGDGICGNGGDPAAHVSYPINGMTGQAADFASSHL
ncbi:cutinase family protein [Mycobacterium parmense]|uniref:Cutinase n=1 Tax=Mycobacterium parmense TaxID=185642 RepID=A0A7I7YYD7_9MYCO|nr:cutinase family protein [Mycobacterium parmense]MCV7352903.1 cutinase family protein [Mycobacterium parmense]ORW55491.1 cutinase [Mycobacterium parmense]BBZ46915.1 cutinase [Mycobacterium parmense]